MEMPSWMPVTVYAIIVLVFVGIYAWRHIDEGSGHRPFIMLVFLVTFQLFNDFVSRMYIYDGFPHLLIQITTYINFLMLPAIGVEWYQFVRSVLTAEERSKAARIDYVVNILAGIGIAVIMMTPVTHWVFHFSSPGDYIRGSYYFVPALSAFLCILIAEVFIVLRVRSLGRRSMITLLFFPLPPLLGAVGGVLSYGIPWMPLGLSISMVVLFANIQTSGSNVDYLTGLSNRKRIEELLEERIEAAKGGRSFGAALLDIDNFKIINDTLGHAVGDIALADVAKVLRHCVRGSDTVGRIGGDEFLVLLDVEDDVALDSIMARIEEECRLLDDGTRRYKLELSKGCSLFDPQRFSTPVEFEQHLDQLMYEEKQLHHARQAKERDEALLEAAG